MVGGHGGGGEVGGARGEHDSRQVADTGGVRDRGDADDDYHLRGDIHRCGVPEVSGAARVCR